MTRSCERNDPLKGAMSIGFCGAPSVALPYEIIPSSHPSGSAKNAVHYALHRLQWDQPF